MTQENQNQSPIKNLDGLQNTHEKLTPQILEELKSLLKEKYGIDMSSDIFHITREELDSLKQELDGNISPKTTLEKFLYDEYIETKLETTGLDAVSLEIVTSGIDSEKVIEMKKKFEENIDPILNSYDFFPSSVKNTIKLALANKFISSQSGEDMMGIIGSLQKGLETGNISALKDIGKNNHTDIQGNFEKTIETYVGVFNKIKEKLSADTTLTLSQKQNIILSSDYFTSPEKLEAGIDEKVLDEIKIENKDTLSPQKLSPEKQEELKQYLLKSKNKLDTIVGKIAAGEEILENGLGLASQEGMVGDTTKDIISFLLKIPILGAIIAILLGLNGNDPVSDFNEQTELFKGLKNLKKLGVQKDESGKIQKKGNGELEGIDFSTLKYSQVKGSLKEISTINQGTPDENFWDEAFSKQGKKINTVSLKLEITPEMKKNESIDSKEFNEIVKKGVSDYQKSLGEEEQKNESQKKQDQRKQSEMETKLATENIATLEQKIAMIDDIKAKKYENITNFSTLIGTSIDELEISKITTNDTANFANIIKDKIGEIKYNTIGSKDYALLDTFLGYVRDYCKEKQIHSGTLKEFLKNNSHAFYAFLDTQKAPLVAQKDKETGVIATHNETAQKSTQITEFCKKIQNAKNVDVTQIEGYSFDREKQQITIGNSNYQISGLPSGAKLDEIIIGENEVKFQGSLGPIPKTVPIAKQEFISGITTLLETGSYKNDKITFIKIA